MFSSDQHNSPREVARTANQNLEGFSLSASRALHRTLAVELLSITLAS